MQYMLKHQVFENLPEIDVNLYLSKCSGTSSGRL